MEVAAVVAFESKSSEESHFSRRTSRVKLFGVVKIEDTNIFWWQPFQSSYVPWGFIKRVIWGALVVE